jgi:general stress protein 26
MPRRTSARTVRRLRQLLTGISVGMLTTRTASGEAQTRPMLLQNIDDEGWLWLLTDRSSRNACELVSSPAATIVFQSGNGVRFVAANGTAVVVKDDLKVKRLWNPAIRAWFPKGRRAPEVVLIAVRVYRVDYWLVPRSRVVRVVGAAKALATGRRYGAGRHGTLELMSA